jgi:hypothetical protein
MMMRLRLLPMTGQHQQKKNLHTYYYDGWLLAQASNLQKGEGNTWCKQTAKHRLGATTWCNWYMLVRH